MKKNKNKQTKFYNNFKRTKEIKKIFLETISLGSPRGIVFMILFGVIFMISVTYFNISSPFKCIFKYYITPFLFGREIECLGCGMTTALVHFFKFEFVEAFEHNKMVFLVVATIVYLLISNLYKIYNQKQIKKT